MKKSFTLAAVIFSGVVLTAVYGLCGISANTYDIPKPTGFAQVREIPVVSCCADIPEKTGVTSRKRI